MNHNISNEEILESAKKIMNDFMKELDKAEKTSDKFGQIRQTNIRPHKETNHTDKEFIQRVFDNAPRKKEGFIVAETQKRDE